MFSIGRSAHGSSRPRAECFSLTAGRGINFPLSVAFASDILGLVLALRREYRACVALAKEQKDYCSEHGFVFWAAAYLILHGVARANVDGGGDSVTEAQTGILNWMKTGAGLHIPTWSSLLAEAALVVGDSEMAEKALSTESRFPARTATSLRLRSCTG
jgi:hypothetical protein